ncbi:MAG: hypothetical protein VX834_01985 [Myxococcota bacterium]|nr:hypothetical protein [Myxococcota bacterium]
MTPIITPNAVKSVRYQPSLPQKKSDSVGPTSRLNQHSSAIDTSPRPITGVIPANSGLSNVLPEIAPIAAGFGGIVTSGEGSHDEDTVDDVATDLATSGGLNTGSFERYIESLTGRWSNQNTHANVNALVQEVLREAYLIQCDQLRDYANRVKFHNNEKKAIREQLDLARTMTFNEDGRRTSAPLYPRGASTAPTLQNPPVQDSGSAPNRLVSAGRNVAQLVTVEEIKTVGGKKITGTANGQGNDIGDKGKDAILAAADRAYEEFESYWQDLSDEEKIALETRMREEGDLAFTYVGEEKDFGRTQDLDKKVVLFTLGGHETVLEFVRDSLNKTADKLVRDYEDFEDGKCEGQADVGQIELGMAIPKTTYDAIKIRQKLQQTSEQSRQPLRSVALGGFGMSSQTETDHAWMKSETIDTETQRDDYVKALEDRLNSVGDDAQLANVDLQNCLQKQQQLISMMSNISKTLHETAMAIIRKMGS